MVLKKEFDQMKSMRKVKIAQIESYLPETVISNDELVKRINNSNVQIKPEMVEKMFGIKERRFAKDNEQVSDMASKACMPIVENIGKDKIDLLIFASVCQDLIEPATSNIIQHKLGLTCPCIDIKNACNSFINALQAATAFINSNMYENILIVSSEKLSNGINFEIENKEHLIRALASLSLGDGAVAAIVSASDDNSGIEYQKFITIGEHWKLCTILGGGSMHPHDGSKNYFEGKTSLMRSVFVNEVAPFILKCFDESPWNINEVDHFITHQVSTSTFSTLADLFNFELDKNISVFENFGNTAATSIPLAYHRGVKDGIFKKGDKIAIVGLAAGVSGSLQLITY